MIHTEQHDSVEGSAGKNGGIPVQHGVEGLFQLQRTTTKGCQLILVPVYFNIGGIFQKMYFTFTISCHTAFRILILAPLPLF